MAINSLQSESAQAKQLDLFEVSNRLYEIGERADQISALAYTVSRDREIDPEVATAIRGLGRLAADLSIELEKLSDESAKSHRSERGENVENFPTQG